MRFPDKTVRSIEPVYYERPSRRSRSSAGFSEPVFDIPGYQVIAVLSADGVEWEAVETNDVR